MPSVSLLIIGGGVAGASLAASLADRDAGRGVCVVDVDVFGKYGTSESNPGGTWAAGPAANNGPPDPILTKLAAASIRYYLENAGKVDFRRRGHVWLAGPAEADGLRATAAAVRAVGLPAEELSPEVVRERFLPGGRWDDVAAALYTPADGRLSAHKLRLHYLNRAQAGGVELMDRWQVVAVEGRRGPFDVRLRQLTGRGVKKALTDDPAAGRSGGGGAELTVRADRVVNAAGPWAGRVAGLYGQALPVTPGPRQVFLLRDGAEGTVAGASAAAFEPLPTFVDTSRGLTFGYYERDRKPCVLADWRDPAERSGVDFGARPEAYCREHVLPRLARRAPALAGAQVVGGWVGHDDPTPDGRPVLGPVADRPGLFNYNGLSGRGVTLSRALGEAMAILLVHNRWPIGMSLDAFTDARFAPDRVGG